MRSPTHREVDEHGRLQVHVDKVVEERLRASRGAGGEDAGLVLKALDSCDILPALRLGQGAPGRHHVLAHSGPRARKIVHVPFAADLDVANVARPGIFVGRAQQGNAVETGKSQARVDGELLKRGEIEAGSRSPNGRGQGEGRRELHGVLNLEKTGG